MPEWFGLYGGLEALASRIRCFEPQFVHGLVQTEPYARAVVEADSRLSADVVEQRVRFRLEPPAAADGRRHDHHGRGRPQDPRRWRGGEFDHLLDHA